MINKNQIAQNIQSLQLFMKENILHGMYISSFDPWLNEYVPMENCHRYYITGFTGSVAEVFVPVSGRPRLYVDGRYHEQADIEVNKELVEVVKCESSTSLIEKLKQDLLVLLSPENVLGIEGDRCSLDLETSFSNLFQIRTFDNGELAKSTFHSKLTLSNKIESVPLEFSGEKVCDKLMRFCELNQGRFITQLDTIAWLSNCRGYQLPYQSVYIAKALATKDQLYVFIDDLNLVSSIAKDISGITFIECKNKKDLELNLRDIVQKKSLTELFFHASSISGSDYRCLKSACGNFLDLKHETRSNIMFHAIKNKTEIKVIRENFKRANDVIFKSIQEAKERFSNGEKITEKNLFDRVNENYKSAGALDLSFKTIVGFDANGSIVHYGDPKEDVIAQDGTIVLLDSGCYFKGGYATDTTRTFLLGQRPSDEQKIVYTLVLKGLIRAESAVFPKGSPGCMIDALARSTMLKFGFDYAHGTGHGVGINVHEGGFRVGKNSLVALSIDTIGSLEPGIYIPGKFGVRLENIVEVVQHPEYDQMLCFRPLTYIGYDPYLVDSKLLEREEIKYLENYEHICLELGTSFGLYN